MDKSENMDSKIMNASESRMSGLVLSVTSMDIIITIPCYRNIKCGAHNESL